MEDTEERFRERSNTWPRVACSPDASPPPAVPETIEEEDDRGARRQQRPRPRRNVWGNKSYAELITEAILSSEQRRMTLSQIYDWMVANVDYFRDKQADTSSAGWKNSIRHNLSLHDCFVKAPNETPGRSHWWTLNPRGRSPRSHPRRRATLPPKGCTADHRRTPPSDPDPDPDPDPDLLPFRRRTKSDCSAYKRPAWESRYVPNYCGTSSALDLEKFEADRVLDSLVSSFKSRHASGASAVQGDVLRTTVADGIGLDVGLDSVAPMQQQQQHSLVLQEAPSPLRPEYAEAVFKFEQPSDMATGYPSSYDDRYVGADAGFLSHCDPQLSPLGLDARLSWEQAFDGLNQDSYGRPRSKSCGGRTAFAAKLTDVQVSNPAPQLDVFDWGVEHFFHDSKIADLSLQAVEQWPIMDEMHSTTLFSM